MQGLTQRMREDLRIAISLAVAALLVLAWIGWAIYVTSDRGADAGLGVVIAWPAMLAALILIALPFAGIYLLIRRLATPSEAPSAAAQRASGEDDEGEKEEDKETEDGANDVGKAKASNAS